MVSWVDCPACGFYLQPEATVCGLCRHDLTAPSAAADRPVVDTPPPTGRRVPVPPSRFVVALIAVVAAGGVVAVVQPNDGPSHPDAWDPRVLDLVSFAEEHRALTFEHPVAIDFLDEAEYAEVTRTEEAGLTDEERDDIRRAEGLLRAVGLASSDVDLLESVNDLSSGGTLAFYDADAERITVKGTELSVAVRVTLVHELVHVLQDQWFDIGEDRFEAFATDGERAAFRALVEGDATRIEDGYVEQLSAADRRGYEEASDAIGTDARASLAEVPSALVAMQQAPYLFGADLLELVASRGGNRAIDDLFTDPPSTEEQLFDPTAYFADDTADEVATPSLPPGVEDAIDEGDFGYAAWLFVLGDRIDPIRAWQAADGWGGDAYVAYELDGRTCVRVAFVGDTVADTAFMRSAMDEWVATMPAGTANVGEDGPAVVLESCDPDDDVEINDRSLEVLQLPLIRVELALSVIDELDVPIGVGLAFGSCTMRNVAYEDFAVLATAESEQEAAPAISAVQAAQLGCMSELQV